MKIYTKTGDAGETSLYDGTRIDKDSLRVEAYGTVDELNSFIGLSAKFTNDEEVNNILFKIQTRLFFAAGELATLKENKYKYVITEDDIKGLENIIDEYTQKINDIDAFIVPGSSKEAAALHVSRTICRRAERRIISLSKHEDVSSFLIKFFNRLSDVLYILARYLEKDLIKMDFNEFYSEKL